MIEKETKIIGISKSETIKRLGQIGAVERGTVKLRSLVFDTSESSLKKSGALLRLRTDGESTLLTLKLPNKEENEGLKILTEVETGIGDFNSMKKILMALGYGVVDEFFKIRTGFTVGQARVEIEEYLEKYSFIPPFIEIEGHSREEILNVAKMLGHSEDELKPWTLYDLIDYYRKGKA